jgi:hypothetical protein
MSMKPQRTVVVLAVLVGVLAVVAAATGLFWQGQGERFMFTPPRGPAVELDGHGLYRYDTVFKAAIFRGTDAVTLFAAVPLLTFATLLYRRGTPRGALVLAGTLLFFVYNSASLALGAAYNALFLVYVAYVSASFFAFVLVFTSIDRDRLATHIRPGLPRRGIAIFLFLTGMVVFVWLIDIVGALLRGDVIEGLATYTTEVTYVLDLGLIVPAALLAGVLLLRRAPLGYPLAAVMLMLNALIGLVVIGQTVAHRFAGVPLTVGQFIAYVGSFVAMSLFATFFIVTLLRHVSDTPVTDSGRHESVRNVSGTRPPALGQPR